MPQKEATENGAIFIHWKPVAISGVANKSCWWCFNFYMCNIIIITSFLFINILSSVLSYYFTSFFPSFFSQQYYYFFIIIFCVYLYHEHVKVMLYSTRSNEEKKKKAVNRMAD